MPLLHITQDLSTLSLFAADDAGFLAVVLDITLALWRSSDKEGVQQLMEQVGSGRLRKRRSLFAELS